METKTVTFSEVTFPVRGMSCGSCVRHLHAALENKPGIKTVEVNLAAGEVTISFNPQTTAPNAIAAWIRESGYQPGIPREEQ